MYCDVTSIQRCGELELECLEQKRQVAHYQALHPTQTAQAHTGTQGVGTRGTGRPEAAEMTATGTAETAQTTRTAEPAAATEVAEIGATPPSPGSEHSSPVVVKWL